MVLLEVSLLVIIETTTGVGDGVISLVEVTAMTSVVGVPAFSEVCVRVDVKTVVCGDADEGVTVTTD